MRFHPKSRASTDHAPGPSSAKATPRVPKRILAHGSPGCQKVSQTSKTATSAPETGVHKPASSSIPVAVASTHRAVGSVGGSTRSIVTARPINVIPATSRMNKSPAPGQPRAKVENSRRRSSLRRAYLFTCYDRNPRKGAAFTLSSFLRLNDPAL
jgi:hypothetical protein